MLLVHCLCGGDITHQYAVCLVLNTLKSNTTLHKKWCTAVMYKRISVVYKEQCGATARNGTAYSSTETFLCPGGVLSSLDPARCLLRPSSVSHCDEI